MCNLCRLKTSRAEYQDYLRTSDDWRWETGEDMIEIDKAYVAPGKHGYIVREVEGWRQLEVMEWGFCTRKKRKRPAREGEMLFLYD